MEITELKEVVFLGSKLGVMYFVTGYHGNFDMVSKSVRRGPAPWAQARVGGNISEAAC